MADFDVRPFDDDGDDHSNDFDPVTDEGWFVPTDFGALGALYPFFLKHYNTDESAEIGATGTGLFNPFLNMNGDSTLLGFNTNDDIKKPHTDAGLDISDPNTDAIQLGDIPIIYRDLDGDGELEAYYVINLDINENVNSEVSLEELQLFTSFAPATLADYHFDEGAALAFENNGGNAATDFTLRFDLDATGANKFIMRDDGAGQGKLDYTFYFPVSMFAGSNPNTYLTLFSQFGPNPADDAGFAEWNTLVAAKITGTKFHDRNGDGVRDADGADNNLATTGDNESPLAGFTMYIDINGNNKLDANEQTALTDANGNFTFGSLLPNASYVIREVLTAADVNGPGDAGTDVNFATYAPPAGFWDQTTGDASGDQLVNVTTGVTDILVGNRLLTPSITIAKSAVVDGDCVDTVGELVNYTILVTNDGDTDLTNVVVTDDLADAGSLDNDADDDGVIDGDTDDDGVLDAGETWTYSAFHTVTQEDIDNNGNFDSDDDGINDVLRNVATVDADSEATDSSVNDEDDATVDVCQDPLLGIVKSATVDGDCVDTVGELVNYTILVSNEGNVGLENVVVTDDMADVGSLDNDADDDGVIDGDSDDDGILDVGETWTYTAFHTVTQDDIDSNGNFDSDDDGINDVLRNIATANADAVTTGEAAEEVTDDATVDVCQDPAIDIEKFVRTDVSGVFADEDDPDGPAASTSSTVDFRVTLTNTGNVTLTNITLSDSVIHTVGGIPGAPVNIDYSDPALGAFIDLDGDAFLDAGEEWVNFDTNGDGTLDIDENGDPFELSVGETVDIYYSLTAALGQHENTAVVTADAATTGEEATDSDDANYFVVATDDCVGVRTPGFWSNPKWMTFWDAKGEGWGTPANEPSQAGTPGFADGELLYKVYLSDTNNDTVIDTNDAFSTGLLVGDYNLNGITDAGEDTIFISLPDAVKLINASSKQLAGGDKTSDGIYMLGRDTVATWLNYLANNQDTIGECIGDVSGATNTPREYLDAAIDWFQQFASTTNGNANQNLVNSYHDGDAQALFQFDARIAPSSASWQNAVTQGENIPVSAAQMHSQLDAYNNTGAINGVEYCCDADSEIALHALTQISLI